MDRHHPSREDFRPLAYLGRIPLTVTNLVLAGHGALLLGILLAAVFWRQDVAALTDILRLRPAAVVEQWQWYRIFTYPLGEAGGQMVWTLVALGAFYFAGNEIERLLGRRAITLLLLTVWLVPPLILMSLYGFDGTAEFGGTVAIYCSVLLASTILYPSAELALLRVEARWLGLGIVVVSLFLAFSARDWPQLLALCVSYLACVVVLRRLGVSHAFFTPDAGHEGYGIRRGGGYQFPPSRLFPAAPEDNRKREQGLPPLFEGAAAQSRPQPALAPPLDLPEPDAESEPEFDGEELHASINPILEKIAATGLASLTEEENAALQKARQRLIELEGR